MICKKCGKTVTDALKHKDSHICKECYEKIFKD